MSALPLSLAEFAPPAPAALKPALVKALLVHLLLLAALTWGISWKREATAVAFEAELWGVVAQQAAPVPQPAHPPVAVAPTRVPPLTDNSRADIKLQQEKARKQALADEQKREKLRQEVLQRAQALAGTATSDSRGSAAQSSSPSSTYKARLRARFIPHIVFPERDSTPGNPNAEVEFRISPDGTILTPSIRIVKASGVPAWDRAVLNAVEKAERIPRDEGGRFPDSFYKLNFSVRE
jgi:colicin import membrane protein